MALTGEANEKAVAVDVDENAHPSVQAWSDLRKEENAPLRALYTMVCLEIAGFAMCIPILAFFAIKELGLRPSQLGIVMSANAAAQLLGSWACGRLSDSFGRRWLLLGSFAWSCMNIGLTAFVYSFTQLLILRSIGGLSGGTTPLCQAYIMDWVVPEKRPSFVGLFGFLCGVAFLAGNALGILLLIFGIDRRTIFLIAAFFASLATIYGLFTIEESLNPDKRRPLWSPRNDAVEKANRSISSDLDAITSGLVCIWCARFFQTLAGAVVFSTYAFFISETFGWSDLHFGALMAIFGLFYALLQFLIYPLLGRHGKAGSAAAAGIACASGFLGGIVMPIPIVLVHLLALSLFTITGALMEPAVPVLVSIFVGEKHLGFGNGVATACRCAASIIGPFLGGTLFEIGVSVMCWTASGLYLVALIGCVGIALSPQFSGPESTPLLAKADA